MTVEHINKPSPKLTSNSHKPSSKEKTPNQLFFRSKLEKEKKWAQLLQLVYKLQISGYRTE